MTEGRRRSLVFCSDHPTLRTLHGAQWSCSEIGRLAVSAAWRCQPPWPSWQDRAVSRALLLALFQAVTVLSCSPSGRYHAALAAGMCT